MPIRLRVERPQLRRNVMIEKSLISACMALIAVGLAAPAGATPAPKHPSVPNFLAAAQAAGVVGVEPAILVNGYNVCWELWQGHYSGSQAAAALQKNYPTITPDQAAHFVVAAYKNLCPVPGAPGAYDWWAYSTS